MRDLEVETRLDVIHRSVESVNQPMEPAAFAKLIEGNLREWELFHATKAWTAVVGGSW